MRPQLFVGGAMVMLLGALFYVTALPLAFSWSIPFLAGGAIMATVSLFVPEGGGPIRPPEGHKFCVFCSTTMPNEVERCPYCNGLQPKG